MSDEHGESEEVGTIAEETAKLFAALQDWARGSAGAHAAAAAHGAGALAESLRGVTEQVGHGPDCRLCPVCQAINVVRETSPEVKQHLSSAATSLLQAVQGMLATEIPSAQPGRTEPVEKIDLDDESPRDDKR